MSLDRLKIFAVGSLIDKGSLNENDIFLVEDQIEIIKVCQKVYRIEWMLQRFFET